MKNFPQFQMTTDIGVDTANASNQKDVEPIIERLDETGYKPGELFANAEYASSENIVVSQ